MLFINGEIDRPRSRYTEFWSKVDKLGIPHEFGLMPTVDAIDTFLQKHLPE